MNGAKWYFKGLYYKIGETGRLVYWDNEWIVSSLDPSKLTDRYLVGHETEEII